MKRCAVAGAASAVLVGMLVRVVLRSSARAEASDSGCPQICAPHAVGLVFARAADRHLHEHGGDRRNDDRGNQQPIKPDAAAVVAVAAEQEAELMYCASIEMAPPMVAAMVIVSVSWFLTCASSCAMTPASSSRLSACSRPVEAQTAAC